MQKPQSSLQKSRTIGNYIITKNLGEGTFGKVKLGIHSITSQKVAIKILQKNKIIDVADVQRVTRQIHILKQIRHPNLIQLYEIIQTPKQLFLVMQYVSEGELFEHIVKKKRLKQNQACQYFRQLIEGVQYMHELGIVHRDLKPENLLIDFNKRLKVVDFGLSNTYKNKQLLKTACGSPCYAAPEMIAGKKYQGLNADIWSCGVILFAMICGYLPFEDPNTSNLYKKITAGDFTIPKFVSPFARDLLQRILTTDPDRRIKMHELKKHAWYKQPIQIDFGQTYGIKVGIHNIPTDEEMLAQVISNSPDYGYEQVRKFISNNRHNHAITIYYLLLKRNLRNGTHCKFDICSPNFDAAHLQRKITAADPVSQHNKTGDDIEEIQLDRLTTATDPRTFRAFSRNNTLKASTASQSPDITAHNFYVSKGKTKLRRLQQKSQGNTIQLDSSQFSNLIDPISQIPSTRRKIYFQGATKNILGLTLDRKNPQKQRTLQLGLYQVQQKKQALSQFYHQDRRSSGTRQTSFRTSLNNRVRRKDQPQTSRDISTRDQFRDRYASLEVGRQAMNRTFVGRKPGKFGKLDNETERIKSILNSTMAHGFNGSGRRRVGTTKNQHAFKIGFQF